MHAINSTVYMPPQQMRCGVIWDLMKVYLEYKLEAEILIHDLYSAGDRTHGYCLEGGGSAYAPKRIFLLTIYV